MTEPPPPADPIDRTRRLERCVRDLAALSALPSMCVGRTAGEALDIVVDALPTVLGCDLVYLWLPGEPPLARGVLRGRAMTAAELAEVGAVTATDDDGADAHLFLAGGTVCCLEAEIPIRGTRGRLVAGHATPLDGDTDRVRVRTAANIVGTILASADALDAAHRKDEFLAMLGHELRNPLAPIITAVELLADGGGREVAIIERNARHLERLVDDLLDVSRLTRGHVELRREAIALDDILDRAIELVTPATTRNRHQVRVERAAGVVVEGDPVRLVQIFGNLLGNATKFTPAGGAISIAARREGDRVEVCVRDTGRGIPRDQLARIFEPFVQVGGERAAQRGLGLGLAIVANLVSRHGGRISVESDGAGSAFTVALPVSAARVPAKASTAALGPRALRTGVRVLVVEDNVDMAELLAAALEIEGFETAVAHDGRSAQATCRTFAPHACVLDVGLPDTTGYDLARALRAEHGGAMTLIAATGYGQAEDRARAAEAGFDCHFVKPMSVRALAAVLDERVVPRVRQSVAQAPGIARDEP